MAHELAKTEFRDKAWFFDSRQDQYDVRSGTANARELLSVVDDTPRDRQSFRFLVPTLLFCCGAMLIVFGADGHDLQDSLRHAGPWAPTAFIVAGIASMSVLVPKTVVSIAAGALFGTPLGSFLMLIIAVFAAALNYAIGRWWLHQSIDKKLGEAGQRSRVIWIRAVRDAASEAGFWFHFLIRLTPIPTTLISYAMGASGSKIRPFLFAAAAAVVPQALWVHSGTAATLMHQEGGSALRWASIVVSVTAAIAISIIIPRVAISRARSMRHIS